jgi:hypothetical protein
VKLAVNVAGPVTERVAFLSTVVEREAVELLSLVQPVKE